jgi:hypothetical protein
MASILFAYYYYAVAYKLKPIVMTRTSARNLSLLLLFQRIIVSLSEKVPTGRSKAVFVAFQEVTTYNASVGNET